MSALINNLTYEQWKQKLIDVHVKETGTPRTEIKVNDEEARQWFADGLDPYFAFLINWKG